MHIVKEGYPFIAFSALLTVLVFYFAGPVAILPLVLMFYFAYFFRNPNRQTVTDATVLYSPADGTVMAVEPFHDVEY